MMTHQPATENEIVVPELKQLLKQNTPAPLLVDVRESFEYEAGAIEGACHVPLSALEEDLGNQADLLKHFPEAVQVALTDQSSAQPIILYCKKGGRSMRALEALRAVSLPAGEDCQARSLAGGYEAWSSII
ncbi:MAG: rhodanese-like domain-containing protein [Cyanobacteria bacterium P01_H01_bin.74]